MMISGVTCLADRVRVTMTIAPGGQVSTGYPRSRARLSPHGSACISSPARRARSSSSRGTATVSSACAMATMRSGRSGSSPWSSSSRNAIGNRQRPRFAHDQIVGLRVAFTDVAGRDRVKQAGGTWNPERRVWQLRYDRVVALGLKSPIVDEPASNTGCPPSRGEHLHSRCPDSIQIEMLASTIGCRHPTADATVCRRIVVSWRSG